MKVRIVSLDELCRAGRISSEECVPAHTHRRNPTLVYSNIDECNFEKRDYVKKQYARKTTSIPAILFCEARDAVVIGDGIVVLDDCVVRETVPARVYRDKKAHGPLVPTSRGDWTLAVTHDDLPEMQQAFLGTRYGMDSYSNWLVEILPRYWLAAQYIDIDQTILMPEGFPSSKKYVGNRQQIEQSLEVMGVDTNFLQAIPKEGCKVKRLTFSSPMGTWGAYSPSILDFFDVARAEFKAGAPARKLYVQMGEGDGPIIHNEVELIELLIRHGFEVHRPMDLSFRDNVILFGSATHVCGVAAPLLANMLFCETRTRVLTFQALDSEDVSYYDLCSLRNYPYYELRCNVLKNGKKEKAHNELLIDLSLAQKMLSLFDG